MNHLTTALSIGVLGVVALLAACEKKTAPVVKAPSAAVNMAAGR